MAQHETIPATISDTPADAPATDATQGASCRPGMMECPICGHEMPDLKGGKATICPSCGFKDSCCY
jgi:transposase-like protein